MAAALALATAGCGGDEDDAAPAAATTAPVTTTSVAAPAVATTTTAAATAKPAAASGAARTPLGSKLSLGDPAVVVYDDTIHHHQSAVRITPQAIEQGTIGDFKNIKLDAGQKTSTPYYVKVDVTNVGKGDLSDSSPGSYLNGVDDGVAEAGRVLHDVPDLPDPEGRVVEGPAVDRLRREDGEVGPELEVTRVS